MTPIPSYFAGPLLSLYETATLLQPPVADSPIANDLAKLQRFATDLYEQVARLHVAGELESPSTTPERLREIRHDLTNIAGRIIGFSDELIVDLADDLTPRLLSDLRDLRNIANGLVGLIRSIGRAGARPEAVIPLVAQGDGASGMPFIPPNGTAGLVLFADDDADNRELVGRLLRRRGGHEIVAVPDGPSALEAMENGDFDLVLLDVRMPGMDGFEVLRKIRSQSKWRQTPVVMISAQGEEEDAVQGIEAGADDYIRRPFNARLFLARVGACLERKRLRVAEDKLFRALFPPEVVDEIRAKGTFPVRQHERVGVLFLDIVGFTAFCEKHRDEPELVVKMLTLTIAKFEEIARKWKVQKIKTIGDAFMATTGLCREDAEPVGKLVECGAEMLASLHGHEAKWEVRIGIHLGPVMAGVIGETQFQYDVWGSTVNTASRLQSSAKPGAIVLSQPAWKSLGGGWRAQPRVVELAGIGEMEIWELYGERIH